MKPNARNVKSASIAFVDRLENANAFAVAMKEASEAVSVLPAGTPDLDRVQRMTFELEKEAERIAEMVRRAEWDAKRAA